MRVESQASRGEPVSATSPSVTGRSPPDARFAARLRRAEEELGPLATAGPPPAGGPLALHRPAPAPEGIAPSQAADLVDRMIVGRTRDGLPEVRLQVGAGALAGTEVRIAQGPSGLEATFVTVTEAARRVVEAQLAELARALEGRGLAIARCEVTARESRGRPRRGARGGGSWEDAAW